MSAGNGEGIMNDLKTRIKEVLIKSPDLEGHHPR